MKVLYVEDSRTDAELTLRELARHAPEIEMNLARALGEAKALLEKDKTYDLALIDLHFVEGSGLDLLSWIRDRELPLAVVIITGLGDELNAVAALKAGANDYIAKREDYIRKLPATLAGALKRFHEEKDRNSRPLHGLYVEHNQNDIDLTQRHLKKYAPHIQLDIVHSAREAIQRLTDENRDRRACDILLLDYHLPGHNALELIKTLHAEFLIDLPTVLVTGHGNEEIAIQALRLGAHDYLVKHPGYLFKLPYVLENALLRCKLDQEKKALKESQEKYRYLTESSRDFIITQDLAGGITFLNKAALELWGLDNAEVPGKRVDHLVVPEGLSEVLKRRNNRVAGDASFQIFETEFVDGRGGRIPVEINSSGIIKDGRVQGILWIARDITARKEAEAAFIRSEASHRTLFETMIQGVVYQDGEGRITAANPAAEQILGLTLDQMLGRSSLDARWKTVNEDGTAYPGQEHPSMLALKTGRAILGRIMGVFNPKKNDLAWIVVNAVPLFKPGDDKPREVYTTFTDITQRKIAQDNLELNESRLRALHEISRHEAETIQELLEFALEEAIGFTDSKIGYIYHYDENTQRFTLNSWSRQVMADCAVAEPGTIYELDKTGFWGEAVRQGKSLINNAFHEDHSWKKGYPEGHVAIHKFMTVPVFSGSRIVAVVGVANKVEDYTETDSIQLSLLMDSIWKYVARKKAENDTLALSERLKHYFEVSPAITYSLLVEGDKNTPNWVSDNIVQAFGYTLEEALRPDWWINHIHPDDRAKAYDNMQKLFEDNLLRHEYRFLTKNGRDRWVRDELRLLRDEYGRPREIVGSWMDITDSKRQEEKIVHLNKILMAIREINKLITTVTQIDSFIQRACDVLYENRGYNSILIILVDGTGRPKTHAESGISRGWAEVEERLQQGILPPCCERLNSTTGIQIITTNNKNCTFCPLIGDCLAYTTMCVRLTHGDTTYGYLSVSIEAQLGITDEEKALFMEMASDISYGIANMEQSREVERMERERARIQAELQQAQKMEAVGRLAGGVAHDFNNMLTVISGNATLALMDLDNNDPIYGYLLEIEAAAGRSADLTRQLLAFSRKQVIEPMVLNINELVTNQEKMLARLIGEDIEITIEQEKDLWPLELDPSQFHQILANLAVNARDAISGVGTISIKTSNITFDASIRQRHSYLDPGEYVLLSFSDTGTGIDQAILPHIFEPFFTTKEEGRGTGLGLSTVYGIVKQNGGWINVYSEEGLGTTFNLYFPRFLGKEDEPRMKTEAITERGSETILVVEDEAQILNLIMMVLDRQGYEVLTANSPGDALLLVEKYSGTIHLLLSDVVMPGMNGKELSERIQRIKPGIKTIFMSGYTTDIVIRHGILEKGTFFIQKPFTTKALTSKVREVLSRVRP